MNGSGESEPKNLKFHTKPTEERAGVNAALPYKPREEVGTGGEALGGLLH